ncbi:MAG: SnoaL-like polyketide cyclase [Pseudomonadota bacterium]|jgi:predicted ester cyclase
MLTLLVAASLSFSPAALAAPKGGRKGCDTDDLLDDYLALFNDRQADWTHVIDPGYAVESPYGAFDLAGWQALTVGAWTAMPDVQWAVERVVVEGDHIALEYSFTGTFENDFMGYVAQNQTIVGRGMEMHQLDLRSCVILRTWNYSDAFGFFAQLQ